ncbi:histone deacetylase, partial [Bonamia ostreae]
MNINKRKISYFYDDRIGNYNYGDKHPMKLNRQRLTDHLIQKFQLYKKMRVFSEINLLTADEMVKFHDEEYIDFLQKIKPANEALFKAEKEKFFDQSFDPEDCPVFDRLFEFCQVYGGTSMRAAERLSLAEDDIVINWSGGAHHAKFNQAAGLKFNKTSTYF